MSRHHHHRQFAEKRVVMPPARVCVHLYDPENLFGTPDLSTLDRYDLEFGGREILEDAGYAYGDLVHVGVSHRNAIAAAIAFPGKRTCWGSGPDGADRALAAAFEDDLRRPDRIREVVLGSGDGYFAPMAEKCAAMGIPVTVLSNPRALSRALDRAATTVNLMRRDFGAWRYRG